MTLFKAMKEADNDEQRLSESEKLRNKRSGDILLFFGKGNQSTLRRTEFIKDN